MRNKLIGALGGLTMLLSPMAFKDAKAESLEQLTAPSQEVLLAALPADLSQKSIRMKANDGKEYDYTYEFMRNRAMKSQGLTESQADDYMRQNFRQYFQPSQPKTVNVDSLWRSALVPGWGQWKKGEKDRALWLGGATALSYAGVIASYLSAVNANNNYRSIGPNQPQGTYDSAFSGAEHASNINLAANVIFETLYLWNLWDAATHKPGNGNASAPKEGVQLGVGSKGEPMLTFNKSF